MDINNNAWNDNEAKIVNYLHGKLSKEEKESFETQLRNDPKLKEHFNQIKNLYFVLKEPEIVRAEQQLLELKNTRIITTQDSGSNLSGNQWYQPVDKLISTFAVGLLLLTITGFGAFMVTLDTDSVYNKYLKSFPLSIAEGDRNDPLVVKANTEFENGNWKQAMYLYAQLAPRNTTYELHYLIAHLSYRKEAKYDVQNLQLLEQLFNKINTEIEEGGNIEYRKRLQHWISYYQALLYIKMQEIDKAKAAINSLSVQSNLPSKINSNIKLLKSKLNLSLFVFYNGQLQLA